MAILRGAFIEARALHRRVWVAVVGALVVWLILVRLQQPQALRQASLPFFWGSVESGLLLALAVLPLVWLASRRPATTAWFLRVTRHPLDGVLAPWLGLAGYGVLVSLLAVILVFTVNSIDGKPPEGLRCLILLVEAALFVLPLAALAPGLSYLRLPTHLTGLLWALLLGGSLLRGFPIPTGSLLNLQRADLTMSAVAGEAVAAAAVATAGGLIFSLALARRHLRTTSCASESSATSTATSKH